MRKNIGMVCAAVAMTALMSLTGCGNGKTAQNEKKEEVHLSVILGAHDNAPQINLALLEDLVYEACYTEGSVCLVVDDGDPYARVVKIPEQEKNLSEKKYRTIANEETRQILQVAGSMHAKTDEVNTLKAVQLAARHLNSCEEKENKAIVKRLVILDSCLSTTGAVDFSKSNLNGISSEDIVQQLIEMEEIPQMEGLEVTVYTCGDTAGNQAALSEANREMLKNVWEGVLEAGGAEVNIKEDLPLSAVYDTGALPYVSPVVVIQDSVEIESEEAVEDIFKEGKVVSFNEKTVGFHPGTAELIDKEKAAEEIGYVIDYMKKNPEFRLLMVGTTACSGGEAYCLSLSQERADRIYEMFVENGIEKDRIKTIGVGYSRPEFYIYDQTPEGELDENIAPLNRTVNMLNLDSEMAERVLKKE